MAVTMYSTSADLKAISLLLAMNKSVAEIGRLFSAAAAAGISSSSGSDKLVEANRRWEQFKNELALARTN